MYFTTTGLTLVALLASIETGLCLDCYQCTSTKNEHCKDPLIKPKDLSSVSCNTGNWKTFQNTHLHSLSPFLPLVTNTPNAPKYCLKLVIEGTSGDTVVRTCAEGAPDNTNKTCAVLEQSAQNDLHQFTSVATKAKLKHCSICNTDNCNGAAGTAASAILAVGAAALTYLAYH